jgi:hypothetical protein
MSATHAISARRAAVAVHRRCVPGRGAHAYIHTYIYTYIHTYIYTYIHIYIHTYIHIPPLRAGSTMTERCSHDIADEARKAETGPAFDRIICIICRIICIGKLCIGVP